MVVGWVYGGGATRPTSGPIRLKHPQQCNAPPLAGARRVGRRSRRALPPWSHRLGASAAPFVRCRPKS